MVEDHVQDYLDTRAMQCFDHVAEFVNRTEQVVIAIQIAWRQPNDSDAELEVVAMIRTAVRALRTGPAS